MSHYTYEPENTNRSLETYEWDNVWWEQTASDADRILYIGDSISCGIRRRATEVSANTLLFDGFGTSKALDNPYLSDSVSLFAAQQGKRRAILFNNGLHGWHLSDDVEYRACYERFLKYLMQEFPGTPIVAVLTTYVKNDEQRARAAVRNAVVRELAERYGLPVLDLYSVSEGITDQITDGVHFAPEGYAVLARETVDFLRKILK